MRWDRISERGFLLVGPAALFCAVALYPMAVWIALPGWFFTSYLRMKGFGFALLFVALAAFFNHGFFDPDHFFWQIGLEASILCSLWIVAFAQEMDREQQGSFELQLKSYAANVVHLEEDLNKTREEKTVAQIGADAKIGTLQNKVEEIEKEYSSLQILNELLRKTTAHHIEEKQEMEKNSIDLQRKIVWMREELSRYEQKRARRDELMQELNAARVAREQTHLINETLAKLHAQKCQEIEKLQSELSRQKVPSSVELLYHQLRRQFDEKTEILHQTRAALFQKETQLETMQKEQEQKRELFVFTLPMQEEFEELTTEKKALEQENEELQNLISSLFQAKPSGRKKKVKSLTAVPLLF